MRIQVLFFGILKDVAGLSSDSPELPEHARLADVLNHYERMLPRFKELMPSLAMSVNQEYASPEVSLKNGDEVAFLPPVSGGQDLAHVTLVRDPIEADKLLARIKQPEDGAVVSFDGVVRNNTRGRRTLYLEYEAYESMALKQMKELAAQAFSRFSVREILVVHRLGHLRIGETSVFIAVASAHRAAAFDACRWLIDSLKRIVPIWKKEFFEDGAVWADGEAFPDTIVRAEGTHSSGA